MSFADGWDRWKLVEHYIENGNEVLGKLNEFIKRQAELETEYSHGMQKLIKQHRDDILRKGQDKFFGNYNIALQRTSVNVAWQTLLDKMEKISSIHSELANSLNNNLRKTVKYKSRDNMLSNKASFDEIRKSAMEISKSFDSVEKLRLKTLKGFKDVDLAHALLYNENTKKKDIEKIMADFDKKVLTAVESERIYRVALDDVNSRQKIHFSQLLQEKLIQIQKDDEQSRVMFIKSAIQKYNQLALDAQTRILEFNESLVPVFQGINGDFDTEFFSKILNGQSEPINNVLPFESLDLESERRPILNGEIRVPDKDLKEIEKLLAFDAKEARKRALAKLKTLEKDVEALSKTMLTMKIIKESVSPDKMISEKTVSETGVLADSFAIKKYVLDSIIAKSDNMPPPQLPLYLSKATKIDTRSIESVSKKNVDKDITSPFMSIMDVSPLFDDTTEDFKFGVKSNGSVDSLIPTQKASKKKYDTRIFAKVIYDFEGAQNTQEMSVLEGDLVEIVEKSEDGWWRAVLEGDNGDLFEGYIPASYLDVVIHVYQKKRREFGKQANFRDRLAELIMNIPSEPSLAKNFTERNPSSVEIQSTVDKSEHDVNTDSISVANIGILHTQGGWPKDVDVTDVEHTIRYRKKIEKDEEYARSVKSLGEIMEHCIKQNNAIDIYEEYFTEAAEAGIIEPPNAKSLNVYRDPNEIKRAASSISWFPDSGHKVAVAYSIKEFQKGAPGMNLESYIWDVENPNAPDQTLIPSSPLVCLKYNPKDPHVLVGGSYSGNLSFWDTRKGSYPVDTSPIEKSHRDPVYNLSWVQSKSGTEFFSVSTDGQVLWWDTRKMNEPTETLLIDPEKNGNIVGGTVLDFETTMPTKFMIGAENGSVFLCNKKAKNPSEKITHIFPGHHGPVYALQRNPFFVKNFLSVGDWKAQIWSEDVRSPIMGTKYSQSYLTDGCWSPTRPSVFFTSKFDGSFDVWDYIFKQNDPTLTVQVTNSPIHSIKVQEHGKLIAVGAQEGSLTILELSNSLSKIQNNEKAVFSLMLEREAKREKTLEGIAREKRLKAAQKRPQSGVNKIPEDTLRELLDSAREDFLNSIDDGSGKMREEALDLLANI